jgi:tRNA (guanine26-N2/guanine27-N2)-dimethyltransferase
MLENTIVNSEIIKEGQAIIKTQLPKIVSKEMEVFYNPIMQLNRDISLMILKTFNKNNLKIADPMAGSGIRSIRFLKELNPEKIEKIYLNDHSDKAIKLIKENIDLNNINYDKIIINNIDANKFLEENKPFDYIDIDPFGSPNPFLMKGIECLSKEGILAVTATDTSSLSGTYQKACIRKYWAKPLRNELMHEIGIRILIRKVQMLASPFAISLLPILSYSTDHYMRIFFIKDKGKEKVDNIFSNHQYLLFCNNCFYFEKSKIIINNICPNCNKNVEYAGPLWSGDLYNKEFIEKIDIDDNNYSQKAKKIINQIKKESKIDIPFFYDIHKLSRIYKFELKKIDLIIENLEKHNFIASRTHISNYGIKTNAKLKEFLDILK